MARIQCRKLTYRGFNWYDEFGVKVTLPLRCVGQGTYFVQTLNGKVKRYIKASAGNLPSPKTEDGQLIT